MDDPEVISFLLQTEIIPLCLRIMDNGSELSKTVATFIIQKILLDDMGLNYICNDSRTPYAAVYGLSRAVFLLCACDRRDI
jgi:CCR4-NOT transcription complex subunit 9